MVQYMLNATIIWAVCLLVYDLFLKQETYHQWNRAYLLLALAAGLIIPGIHLPEGAPVVLQAGSALNLPSLDFSATQSTAAQLSIPAYTATHSLNWIWLIYVSGVALSLLLLLKDAIKLIILYRKGRKQQLGAFTVVETNKPAGPFSLFHLIFISNWHMHTEAEWQMILQHEYRHARLKHGVDLLLLHALQTILWFHPLVYIFKRKLQLIHEYQADEIARDNYTTYGAFLLEQNLMNTAPTFAHSFHHSPIKNRIIMLTKTASARSKKAKYLLAIPMCLAFVLACSVKSFSHEKVRNGNKETFKGNVFEYPGADENVQVKSPAGDVQVVTMIGEPVKLNGERIYRRKNTTVEATYKDGADNMVKVVFDKIHDKLDQLGDGEYHIAIFSTIIDKKGNFAYYSVRGVEGPGWALGEPEPTVKVTVPKELQKELVQDIESVLDNMKFTPAQLNGKPVNVELNNDPFFHQKIIVKNHKAILQS